MTDWCGEDAEAWRDTLPPYEPDSTNPRLGSAEWEVYVAGCKWADDWFAPRPRWVSDR
jgi:hypothetical protein